MDKLNKTILPHTKAKAADIQSLFDKVDEIIDNLDASMLGIKYVRVLTLAEYDALPVKDDEVLYLIKDPYKA